MIRPNARNPTGIAATFGPALLIGILAAVVSARTPLWRDEVATLSFAELPLPDLLRAVTHVDGVMLPYYLAAHLTQLIAPGPFSLRLPSVIGIAVATAATAAVAGRWWGRAAALAAGLALALNPLAIQQGATARPYALATCFVALAGLALARAVAGAGTDRGRVVHWAGYAACLALAGLSHLFALLAIPAFFLLAAGARRLGRWAVATAVGVAAVLPLAVFAFGQRGQVDWIQRPNLRSGVGALASLLTFRSDSAFGPLEAVGLGLITLAAAAAVVLAMRRPKEDRVREGSRVAFALASFGGPWLVLFCISLVWSPYLRTTYLTPSLVGLGFILGAVAGLGGRWAATSLGRGAQGKRLRGAAVAAVVVAPLLLSGGMAVGVVTRPWYVDDLPSLGRALAGSAKPGDVLVVVQLHNEVGVASGLARVMADEDYTAELQRQLVTGEQPRYGVRRIISVVPLRTEAIDRVPATGAVWAVYTRGAFTPDDYARIAPEVLGCTPGELAETGSFGILRLASAGCAR